MTRSELAELLLLKGRQSAGDLMAIMVSAGFTVMALRLVRSSLVPHLALSRGPVLATPQVLIARRHRPAELPKQRLPSRKPANLLRRLLRRPLGSLSTSLPR